MSRIKIAVWDGLHPTPLNKLNLCCFFHAKSSCPDCQLLREQLQIAELIVQTDQLAPEYLLVVALLFLQAGNLDNPAFQRGRAAAAALDEVVRFLLVLRNLLLDCDIELLRHLVALLGVVDDVEAVRRQEGIVFVEPVDGVDEARRRMENE